MTDMKIVTFKKGWRGYAVGETAGFDPDAADALIKSGRANLYVEKVTAEKAGKPPAAKPGKGKTQTVKPVPEQQQEEEQQKEELQQEQQEQQENEEFDEKP